MEYAITRRRQRSSCERAPRHSLRRAARERLEHLLAMCAIQAGSRSSRSAPSPHRDGARNCNALLLANDGFG